MSMMVALVVYPAAIELERKVSQHSYGVGFGLGWGAVFFFLLAALCMCLDDVVRTVAKCCCPPSDRDSNLWPPCQRTIESCSVSSIKPCMPTTHTYILESSPKTIPYDMEFSITKRDTNGSFRLSVVEFSFMMYTSMEFFNVDFPSSETYMLFSIYLSYLMYEILIIVWNRYCTF